MELYHTTDADGITEINPSEARMRELLDELDDIDITETAHPDVSLIHDFSGWMLTVYPRGIISFENLDQNDEAPRFMKGVSRKASLELWLELSRGQIDKVNARNWQNQEA